MTPDETSEQAARRLIDSVGIEASTGSVKIGDRLCPATIIRRRRPEHNLPIVFRTFDCVLEGEVTITANDATSARKLYEHFYGLIQDQKDTQDDDKDGHDV